MLRRLSFLALVLAALTAAEPILHNHPLDQRNAPQASESRTCAICATSTGRLPVFTAAIAAPTTIVYTVVSVAVSIITVDGLLPLPSRAPPAP